MIATTWAISLLILALLAISAVFSAAETALLIRSSLTTTLP